MKKYKFTSGIGAALLALILLLYFIKRHWQNQAISIIGGADGPTSIFIAGKLGNLIPLCLISGILILLMAVLIYFLINKK